jgi:hypothetical protein
VEVDPKDKWMHKANMLAAVGLFNASRERRRGKENDRQ